MKVVYELSGGVQKSWEEMGEGRDWRRGEVGKVWDSQIGRWEPPTGRRCGVKGRRDGRCVRRPTFGLIGATSRALPAKYHLPCVFTGLVMWMRTALINDAMRLHNLVI